MNREEAIKTLKENYCAMCPYGSQNMDSCNICICDNRDAIKALEQDERTCEGCLYEMNSGFEEECHYCNRCGSDRYVNKEEYYDDDDEDEDDE